VNTIGPREDLIVRSPRIVIVGGGTAGITVAARLQRAGVENVTIVEPCEVHRYQPLLTLVGAGVVPVEITARPEARYIPKNATWVREAAAEIDPDAKCVVTAVGTTIPYDFLIVAPGLQLDWSAIVGLPEVLGRDGVSSVYTPELAPHTRDILRAVTGGTVVFTSPSTPVKCGGAWQKIAYLAADHYRREGTLSSTELIACSPGDQIFGVPEFRVVLEQVVERYGIDTRFHHELVEVRASAHEAVFRVGEREQESRETITYDALHVVPPQSAPDWLKASPLARPDEPLGWVDVDGETLRHVRYPEVFSLGDAAGSPNSKTGAAVRKQAPVVVANLRAAIADNEPTGRYDGYSSCPVITARGKVVLAEFDYTMRPHPTIPLINTAKERRDMWLLKRYGLPFMYWHLMLRGRA
jgi:sulfide:quinone oxidoreductase